MKFWLTEKIDGSLGIHYRWNGEDCIATRGSFHSDQAEWATDLLRSSLTEFPLNETGAPSTLLFEIVYPQNRVVVDYGERRELVFLEALDIATGDPAAYSWPLSGRATPHEAPENIADVATVWAHIDDGNHEGFVATFEDGYRIKIKLSEYVRLHRIMSSTSNRTIWEALRVGTDIGQMMESVPDEFMDWVREQVKTLEWEYTQLESAAAELSQEIQLRHVGAGRKELASQIVPLPRPYPSILFAMLDGKDFSDTIWKSLRPDEINYPPIGGSGESADDDH